MKLLIFHITQICQAIYISLVMFFETLFYYWCNLFWEKMVRTEINLTGEHTTNVYTFSITSFLLFIYNKLLIFIVDLHTVASPQHVVPF